MNPKLFIFLFLQILLFQFTFQQVTTTPNFCPLLSNLQSKQKLCPTTTSTTSTTTNYLASKTLFGASWCFNSNFKSSLPIDFKDPDITNCKDERAKCFSKLIQDNNILNDNPLCFNETDLLYTNYGISFLDILIKNNKIVEESNKNNTYLNRNCITIHNIYPIEIGQLNTANKLTSDLKELLLIVTNQNLILIDMKNEKFINNINLEKPLLNKKESVTIIKESSDSIIGFLTYSKNNILKFKIKYDGTFIQFLNEGNLNILNYVTEFEELQKMVTMKIESTFYLMINIYDLQNQKLNALLFYNFNTNKFNRWDLKFNEKIIYTNFVIQGQFDTTSVTTSDEVKCHKTLNERSLIILSSSTNIYILGFLQKDLQIDVTSNEGKYSLIYSHGISTESITSVSAFTECFGSLQNPSQNIWLTITIIKNQPDSTNNFKPFILFLNLNDFSKLKIDFYNAAVKQVDSIIYLPNQYDAFSGTTFNGQRVATCQALFNNNQNPILLPQMPIGNLKCTDRTIIGPITLTNGYEIPKRVDISFYKSAETAPKLAVANSQQFNGFYKIIGVSSLQSMELFLFQEIACDGAKQPLLQQVNMLYLDSYISEVTFSNNGQHLFITKSRKYYDIFSNNRLSEICQKLQNNLNNPNAVEKQLIDDSLSQFKTVCNEKNPSTFTIFDYISYYSMCNSGTECPRFGDLGLITNNDNSISSDAEMRTLTVGNHLIRPMKTYACEPGYFCNDIITGKRKKCPPGFKCSTDKLISPQICNESNDFSSQCINEGTINEEKCPDGKMCLNPGNSLYSPPGFYLKKSKRNVLYSCSSGQYCPLGASIPSDDLILPSITTNTRAVTSDVGASLNCPSLYYCESPDFMLPIPCISQIGNQTQYCPTGTFVANQKCPPGYYCPTLSSKKPCEQGYYCPEGSYFENPCPAGYYCPNPTVKYICPSGSYCPAGSAQSKPCQLLGFCPEGSTKEQNFYLGILLFLIVIIIVVVVFVVVRVVSASYKKKKMKQKSEQKQKELLQSTALGRVGFGISELIGLGGTTINDNPRNSTNSTTDGVHIEDNFINSQKIFTMNYKFEDLSLVTKKTEKVLLENVTGTVYSKRTTCILSIDESSGEALLKTLAGRTNKSGYVRGDIYINDQLQTPLNFRSVIGYVPKKYEYPKELKVHELLRFTAHTRLPSNIGIKSISQRVEQLAKLLGIENFFYDSIGKSKKHGIDENVRVLLNIALELVADPTCLFLENIIQHLPLESSKFILQCLKQISLNGTTVVMCLDHPRNAIFTLFDDVILLGRNGNVVYNGPTSLALKYFEEIGFKCPVDYNPPDFCLDVCSGNVPRPGDLDFDTDRLLHLWELKKNDIDQQWNKLRKGLLSLENNNIEDNKAGFGLNRIEEEEEDNIRMIDTNRMLAHNETDNIIKRKPIGFLGQYLLFTVRALLQISRHYKGVFFDFFFHFAITVIIGAFYFNMQFEGPMSKTLQNQCPPFLREQCSLPKIDKIGPMSLLTIAGLAIAAMQSALKCFGQDKELYRREVQNGINKTSYFFGKLTAQIPSLVIYPLLFTCFWFVLVNPKAGFGVYYGLFILIELVFNCLGYAISVFIQRTHGEFVGVMFILFSSCLAGIQPTVVTMSKEWYSLVLVCISPIRWAVELMYCIELKTYDDGTQNVNAALDSYGYSYTSYYISPSVLVSYAIIFLMLAFIGLVFRDPNSIEWFKTNIRLLIRKLKRKLRGGNKTSRSVTTGLVTETLTILDDDDEMEDDEDEEDNDLNTLDESSSAVYQPPLLSNNEEKQGNNIVLN
ncbi:hypothetical protein ABK040_002358 [Willaertia magna]